MEKRYFVTGDKHGDLRPVIDFIKRFDLQSNANILILGDTGLFWRKDKKDAEKNIDFYEKECNGVHLYWIDGNHENFDIINKWNTKTVYNNSPHIHYCPRGYITEININNKIKKILFIGGADSVDKYLRTEHLNWWKDETILYSDIQNAFDKEYDYVFSHCGPMSIVNKNKVFLYTLSNLDQGRVCHDSELILDILNNNIKTKNWWFGHYHINKDLGNGYRCLFEDFIELK